CCLYLGRGRSLVSGVSVRGSIASCNGLPWQALLSSPSLLCCSAFGATARRWFIYPSWLGDFPSADSPRLPRRHCLVSRVTRLMLRSPHIRRDGIRLLPVAA